MAFRIPYYTRGKPKCPDFGELSRVELVEGHVGAAFEYQQQIPPAIKEKSTTPFAEPMKTGHLHWRGVYKNALLVFMFVLLTCASCARSVSPEASPDKESVARSPLYEMEATSLSGKEVPLSEFEGKVLLVSNIALKCGTTPQLTALQGIYDELSPRGLVVLGFPSSDFSGSEPADHKVIRDTCKRKFGVTFPVLRPGAVRGSMQQPVFRYLSTAGPESMQGDVSFNFEKFLIDRSGRLRHRFGPFVGAQSDAVREEIENLLRE